VYDITGWWILGGILGGTSSPTGEMQASGANL